MRLASEVESEEDSDDEFYPVHFPAVPCVLVIANHEGYLREFETAIAKLESDGLVFETTHEDESHDEGPAPPSNELISTVGKVERVMELCSHALYRGHIYTRPDKAELTYVKLMDVSSYLHKLLANDAITKDLLKHFKNIENILSHPACEMIQQLRFDYNLIEVSNGFCFNISQRAFLSHAINESEIGKLSPRAYVPYDCSSSPRPGYFRDGVLNSFENEEVRLNFLNKFFQCLVPFKMPQKTRKLAVVGPRDSGKTAWASVLHRIVPKEYIASVTSEHQFSASMITEATQLVVIDEWSNNTMNADLAKTLLQGGWMVTAVKHGQPRCVNCYSPFYITANNLPDFRTENENVQRRIQVFNTTSLPVTHPNVDRWIYDNAMHCIAWVADQINEHRHLIDPQELWYEEGAENNLISSQMSQTQWERAQIVQITQADLEPVNAHASSSSTKDTLHEGFVTKARSRRLARKRQRRRNHLLSDSSSESDVAGKFHLASRASFRT